MLDKIGNSIPEDPLCVFICCLNWLLLRIHSRICCICLIFLHCAFSNDPSNSVPEKRYSHIGCICFTFLHCAFSNVPSNSLPKKRHSRIGCIGPFSTVHFLYVASNGHYKSIHSHIGCIFFYFSPLCVFLGCLKWLLQEDAESHRLHLFDFSPLYIFK